MLPQHPDEHRLERLILLAVDQQLGEGAALRVAPELSDPVCPLEVREHEDVEQLGAGRAEGVQGLALARRYLDTSQAVPSLSASRVEFARYTDKLTRGL